MKRKCVTNEWKGNSSPFDNKSDRRVNTIAYNVSGILRKSWPVPFLKCDSRKCTGAGIDQLDRDKLCEVNILVIATSDDSDQLATKRVDDFAKYIYDTYPQISSKAKTNLTYDFVSKRHEDKMWTESKIKDYVKSSNYGKKDYPKIGVAVILEGGNEKQYGYEVRINSTNVNSQEYEGRPSSITTPSTKRLFDNFAISPSAPCAPQGGTARLGNRDFECTAQYIYNGALPIQRLIHDWILHDTSSGATVAENGVSFVNFPTRKYVKDGFYASIEIAAPLLLVLGLMYPMASTVRSLVQEKEFRQKELMKMMSITEFTIESSWLASFSIFFFIIGILCTIVSDQLYENSSGVLLFIFWQLALLSILMFSFVMASFSSKSSRATLISVMLFFIGYFISTQVRYDGEGFTTLSLCSLHPVAAITYGIQIIGSLEDKGPGLTRTTMNSTDNPSGYTFGACLTSLFSDIIIWGLLSWYLNRVVKGEYGQSLSWNFFFTKKYWVSSNDFDDSDHVDTGADSGIPIEPVSDTMKAQETDGTCVSIRNLSKQFDTKTAVDGLSLTMYNGQITALLGHNGAGKTTTINMLTGMVQPTSGYAVVNGKNIISQMSKVRENVGICLQHDCLFPMLTVKEHIEFFARVKGLYENKTHAEANAAVKAAVEDVALAEKINTFSKDLSGGMKRKLSVAIAFCGGSNVVFLDEPTSGMDPFSRRFTWDVIRQYRQNRCIILTTHFMDEADLLGDRIAIMSEGQLRCCGSSLFLKKKYGVGYQLTIEKVPQVNNSGGSKKIENDLQQTIKESVSGASLLSNVGTEMSFQLPLGASAQFIKMFEELDAKVQSKDIVTYGVSITTLDEVFLMVARGENGQHQSLKSSLKMVESIDTDYETEALKSYRSQETVGQVGLFSTHVRSLIQKRALNFKRDKKAWCCSAVMPLIVSLIGFLIVTLVIPGRTLPSLKLSLKPYNSNFDGSTRNPIIYNNPGKFTCQPGKCIYPYNIVPDTSTGKTSYSCGASVELERDTPCVISQSNLFGERLRSSREGAYGIGETLTDVSESSRLLYKKSEEKDEFSIYGALYFTHDNLSTLANNASQSYNEKVEETCNSKKGSDCPLFRGIGYVVSTNFTSLHSSLLFQSLADQAILRESTGVSDIEIKPTIHPLPLTLLEDNYAQAENSFAAWFLLVLSFPFITGAYVTFVVTERMTKAKHLQTVAGVKPEAYWISTYMWDMVNYQIPLWGTVFFMYVTDLDAFTRNERDIRGGVIAVLTLYGPAAAGFTYCVSFLFKSPSTANLFVIIFNFFIGFAGPLVCFILRLISASTNSIPNEDGSSGDQSLKNIAVIIESIGRFIPSFSLGKALFFIINIDTFSELYSKPDLSVWSPEILRTEVIFLAWEGLVYVWLAILIDRLSNKPRVVQMWKSFVACLTCRCIFKSNEKDLITKDETPLDDDVAEEVNRIYNAEGNDDLIVLSDLTKVYNGTKLAVDHLTFGIPAGECFGLLGINGAGKTSAMAMLTAEFPPSEGDATLAGFSVTNQPEQTRRRIGYCPQFDAHFQTMTGREHVELYASIKGIPRELVKEAAAAKLKEVGLSDYDIDRLSSEYSGGMKRKLSVACATIGNPEIVFLDEPSTGMDPVARRDLWKVISNMVISEDGTKKNASIILTTHSMEECEALCPRIGIMAGGALKCLGSAQHLKTRFGQGFQVEVKVKAPEVGDDDFQEILETIYTVAPKDVSNNEDDEEEQRLVDGTSLNFNQIIEAAKKITSDNYLAPLINKDNPRGYLIFKNASSSVGIPVKEAAHFFAEEMRVKKLQDFFENKYSNVILRERQDIKVRYEIGLEGLRIASLFSDVEDVKDELNIADYGISQTSLEQVFNMHAAEAEMKKKGTIDG
eukprot:CAMPEP_0197826650 /NCGR_PEP_ID=MMETSP1437-20131217/3581_1 /TAXON_ID=49252 ORGANISM="Eucampia antarctica, Strain CCMP1452" /NCGR_SAMPLE_ID=MMETSP1437 /ASSEMBLY_ACC=CAM_ASM_001096 /LENGTH=1876 /DNA_ID=CAMNT_0043427175 /DNA_START=276 /DNA_END=5906 /DNA_ORIENTATION=-